MTAGCTNLDAWRGRAFQQPFFVTALDSRVRPGNDKEGALDFGDWGLYGRLLLMLCCTAL